MSTINYSSPVLAFVDSSKGSLTNRFECAKEHAKNNVVASLKLGTAAAAGTYVAIAKPSFATKFAKTVGKGLGKLLSKLGASKVAAKILKNPTKAGAAGLIAAGALWAVNTLSKHCYKAGQIDQKYTDAAAIESTTKNVILDNNRRVCTPEEIKEFYANGGRGIYV